MKNDIPFTIGDLPIVNPVQERIKLLYDNDFLIHEKAALSRLRKKLIKQITKGKYLPVGKERDKLCKIFDELILKLNIKDTEATFYEGECPEAEIDTTDYSPHNLLTNNLLIFNYINRNMIVCETAETIYGLCNPDARMHLRADNKRMIIIIRGDLQPGIVLSNERPA